MRTLDLLKAFSENELEEIAEIISQNKRAGLWRLFKGLMESIHKDAEPDNAKLFKKVFGSAYTKQKDYLLRNELRLLNEILYKYLAEKTALSHLDQNKSLFYYWLTRGYFDRKIKSLFRSDIDDFLSYVSSHQQSFETISLPESPAMYSMKSLWMIDNQPKLPENIQQQIEVLQQWKNEEKKRFLYRIREMEAREAYLQWTLQTVLSNKKPEDQRTAGETLIDLSDFERNDILPQYSLLKKHAFQTTGKIRIEVLKETLKFVKTDKAISTLDHRAMYSTLNQLGMELIISGHYEEGNKYLEQAIAQSEEQKWPQSFSTIHNYMVNQINLEAYEKGIEIYQRYKTLIEANRLKYPGRVFLAYFHLYLGHDDEAIRLIPKEAELSPPLQIISRFIYSISFLMRQEYTLAISEIKNLKRTVKAIKNGDYSKQLLIIDLYQRYANAYIQRKDERIKALSELKNEMVANREWWLTIAAIDVQLYWLMKKLEEV